MPRWERERNDPIWKRGNLSDAGRVKTDVAGADVIKHKKNTECLNSLKHRRRLLKDAEEGEGGDDTAAHPASRC